MLLLVFLIVEKHAYSQSIGGNVFAGNIIRHRDFLLFDQPDFTAGFELEYVVKKDTISSWQNFWRLPDITHHFHLHSFGNPTQLGFAFAYYPSISFRLMKSGNFSAHCEMGNGISYHTKRSDNTAGFNNAIGSRLNSLITLGFEFRYVGHNNLDFHLGPQIFHYSNGAAKAPNAGINSVLLNVGVRYVVFDPPSFDKASRYKSLSSYDKWNWEVNVGLGFRQINIPNGLNYRIPQVSLFAHYNLFEHFRIVGGFSYQYNYADYYFMKTQFETNEVAAREARDFMTKVSGDFLFGNLFARFQFGFYLPLEEKRVNDPFSTMFSLNYARKIISSSDNKLFFGIGVRSHKFVAQYLSINAGFIL